MKYRQIARAIFRNAGAITVGTTLSCNHALAQLAPTDTTSNHFRVDIKSSSIGVHVGVGIQGSFCYKVGVARNSFIGSPHGLVGSSFYAVFASFPAFRRRETTASGFRAGADFYGNGGLLGLEVSSFWAARQQDVLIAPKVGVGIPEASVFYAYHFSTNAWAVGRVGKHEVGIQASPYLWHHDKLRGKKNWFWMRRNTK